MNTVRFLVEGPELVGFQVDGLPVGQGRHTPYIPRHVLAALWAAVRARRRPPRLFARVKPSNEAELKRWRKLVASRAEAAWGGKPLVTGPVSVALMFCLPRPKTVPFRKRPMPTGRRSGDLDKYIRAVLDALTGEAWVDDSQVCTVWARKVYEDARVGARPGVGVVVMEDALPSGSYEAEGVPVPAAAMA